MDKDIIGLNDSQRAQLLILYKEKLQSLGDEVFFDQFDDIRAECYEQIGALDDSSNIVFFASWRCNCTYLTKNKADISMTCPEHGERLLDVPRLTENMHNVPLGFQSAVANAASKLGRRGGESTSDSKVKAARENGRKGGRKKGSKSTINQLSLEDI